MTTEQRNAMFYDIDVSAWGLIVFDNNLNAFYVWDDYVVILTGAIPANTFALPTPVNNQFRVLCVKNNMSGTLIPLAANGSAWPANMSNLAAGAAVMFISDGVSWNNISR